MSQDEGLNALHPVSIDVSDPVRPVVMLDGRNITGDLAGLMLSVSKRELPELVLNLTPTAGVTFDGFARVVVGVPPDLGPAAEAFLAHIEPGELQARALERVDEFEGPTATTQAILAQLREWARGGS